MPALGGPPYAPSPAARWVRGAVGALALVAGAVLAFRPFSSLAVLVLALVVGLVVLAVGDLLDARTTPRPRAARWRAVGWLVAAALLLALPGLGIRGIALLVGLALVLDGASDLWAAVRSRTTERLAGLVRGAASVVLGVLALAWPGVTLLVVAVLFGLRLAWYGVTTLWAAVRPRPAQPDDRPVGPPSWWLRSWHVARAGAALLVALALLGVSSTLRSGSPSPDAFYGAPDDVPSEPGSLLRAEPFDRAIPDGARAWRILYTTTRDEGEAAVASALVVAPRSPEPDPLPVIAWAHGTTGASPGCAPSLLRDPFAAGATPALDEVVERGWAMVATDYVGLGTVGPHPYLIGQGEGRSVLDAVRAARQLSDLDLGERTVIWGHSQGGNAALWAGQLADSYAPDVAVDGVAALAPASDLPALVANLDVVPGGAIFASYVVASYADVYDDVAFDDYVRPTARLQVREMASRRLAEPEVFVSVVSSLLFDRSIWSRDPVSGAFGERLAENVPDEPLSAPLLLAQGDSDALVLPAAQDAYAESRCALGDTMDYRVYEGFDHVGVVGADSPLIADLLSWTQDRIDGRPAPSTC